MTFQIERVRTAILVRNSRGYYRIVYFAHMPRERVMGLLHEYGLEGGEVLAVESFGIAETIVIDDGQLAALLQAAYRARPFAATGGNLGREAVAEWAAEALQGMLPRGYRLAGLSERQKIELHTIVNTIVKAL